jgi:hypothetical protein
LAFRSYRDCLLKLVYRIIDIDFLPIETLLQGHKGIHSHEEIWISVQEKDDLARQNLITRSSKWWMFLTEGVGNSYSNPLLQFRSQWEARILNTASRNRFFMGRLWALSLVAKLVHRWKQVCKIKEPLRTEGDTLKTLAPSTGIYSMLLMCLCMCRWVFIQACVSYLRNKTLWRRMKILLPW